MSAEPFEKFVVLNTIGVVDAVDLQHKDLPVQLMVSNCKHVMKLSMSDLYSSCVSGSESWSSPLPACCSRGS